MLLWLIPAQSHAWYRVISYNADSNYMIIEISGELASGTDAACEIAAEIFHEICKSGVILEVRSTTGFVPSAVNPMTLKWTSELVRDGNPPLGWKFYLEDHENYLLD